MNLVCNCFLFIFAYNQQMGKANAASKRGNKTLLLKYKCKE